MRSAISPTGTPSSPTPWRTGQRPLRGEAAEPGGVLAVHRKPALRTVDKVAGDACPFRRCRPARREAAPDPDVDHRSQPQHHGAHAAPGR